MSEELNSEYKEYKGHRLKIGRYLFNKCLPDNYPVIDATVTRKGLMAILNDIALRYPSDIVIRTLDNIKSLGFTHSTLHGYTLGIDDLYSEELMQIADSLTGDIKEDMKKMSSERVNNILNSFSFADYIKSGARGSWEQAKQLVLARGYVSDSKGRIRPNVIRGNLVKGLTQREFFDSCWGSRKGLLDTALSTGDSGYLTRQLIYSCISVEFDESVEDCGNTDTLKMFVKDDKMAKSLLWRNYEKDGIIHKITSSNFTDITGETINLVSPIFCKSPKICKKCYGDLYKILHSDQIGVMAAQAIGEITVQLVLRTFHLSGVANINEEDSEKQDDIISGINIANKLLHKPKDTIPLEKPEDLVNAIYNVFSEYKSIHMVHYEIIVSSMMWVDDIPWRLVDNRDSQQIEWVSILQSPTRASWLLGCAFSNLKAKLLEGLLQRRTDNCTALSRLFKL